jgi:hypothetical protein
MFGNFTAIEVADPHQTSRLIWENMPQEEKALEDESHICSREFTALDWRRPPFSIVRNWDIWRVKNIKKTDITYYIRVFST